METKNRLYKTGLLSILFCGLALMVFLIVRTKRAVADNYSGFKFYDLNDRQFSGTMLNPGKAIIILFADPDCEICRAEVRQISDAGKRIPKVEVVVVVSGTLNQARYFSANCPAPKAALFHFVYDRDQVFTYYFGRHATPSLFILNKNHQLAKCFQGETSTGSIIAAVNDISH